LCISSENEIYVKNLKLSCLYRAVNRKSNDNSKVHEPDTDLDIGGSCKTFIKYYLSVVNEAKLVQNFISMFISFLYMFRATVCPSSGETTVFMRHFYLVVPYE